MGSRQRTRRGGVVQNALHERAGRVEAIGQRLALRHGGAALLMQRDRRLVPVVSCAATVSLPLMCSDGRAQSALSVRVQEGRRCRVVVGVEDLAGCTAAVSKEDGRSECAARRIGAVAGRASAETRVPVQMWQGC